MSRTKQRGVTSGSAPRDRSPCRSCLGRDTYEDRLVSFPFQFRGRLILFENVPASVCSQCGEKLFSGDTADLMDKLARGETPPTRMTEVPVYDLAEVA